ncbi:MAG: multidrug effflux MFS transporter [Pseudomonadota bacterium]
MDNAAAAATREPHPGVGFVEFVALVAGLMALNALSIDVMLPGLPAIGDALGVTEPNHRQLVLGAYLVAFGGAQLFYGPLTDRYGRRPVLLAGIALYVVATLVAAMASSFEEMLWARFVQGLGAASTRVIAVAIARDCYGGREMGRVMSLAMMVFVAVPILAPSIGQLVLFVAPWRWIFGLLFVGGLGLLLWVALRLPETLSVEHRLPLSLRAVAGAFASALTTRVAAGYMLAQGIYFGALFGFIASAQQILQDVYGVGDWFTVLFAVIALALTVASFLNARYVRRVGLRRLAHGGLAGCALLSSVHLALALLDLDPLFLFVALQAATLFLFGFVAPNMNALAMEPLGHIAGTGSAVVGTAQTLVGAILGTLVGQAFDGTVVPLVTGYVVFSVGALAVIFWTERGRLFQPQRPPT